MGDPDQIELGAVRLEPGARRLEPVDREPLRVLYDRGFGGLFKRPRAIQRVFSRPGHVQQHRLVTVLVRRDHLPAGIFNAPLFREADAEVEIRVQVTLAREDAVRRLRPDDQSVESGRNEGRDPLIGWPAADRIDRAAGGYDAKQAGA